ncbi:lysine-specific demethylase JMJ25-like [Chenopodium quinoa]|uniref:lysine-specific demethylase JMJ25-like n=1 Tax=Chenopodium quinoa TaxID=63459 RepID=UPI000B791ECC|nr:lysine-specific demethylase JMJ25-like [Chenopodium quinoa]XP_021742534.1 lysine-specific demethylase JMJ25-like [Chenopodium quinoa]
MDDQVGIPDDLRCKRSDGKQWRCTAMSMPDKTVCEKHYIQAKKRAANSALRASLKKAKRKSMGETGSPIYMESRSDDNNKDMSLQVQDFPVSGFPNNHKDRMPPNGEDDMQKDLDHYDHSRRSYTPYGIESSRNMSQKSIDDGAMVTSEVHSDASTDSTNDTGGLTCHQCRRSNKVSVIWCHKCDRKGYCESCISTWYANISLEEIQRVCPACRGMCNCKVCSRVDNLIKAKIRDIPVLDKLQYLYCLLSSVLPVVKEIHQQQCAEVDLEKKLHGAEVDLERTKLNADEQMCCDCCRVPIVDYHRHCSACSYDLCLRCCQDLRSETLAVAKDDVVDDNNSEKNHLGEVQASPNHNLLLSVKFPGWRASIDGSVPCLPREHGGCGCSYLTLRRIFKMNWVAKLVKNLEEMVSGCKVKGISNCSDSRSLSSRFLECASRKESDDNFLYCPSAQDIKLDGVVNFRKHWAKGEPVLVKQVCDGSSSTSWDPMVIWREICESTDERMNDASKMVKAVDCLDWSEVDIELGQFMKGYSEGLLRENGSPQMLKLKDWPSPSASEEFFLYQRPEFISKVPFLEFIHSKWGLLNVAAKLPHYSLQNDVGPKIFISYGLSEELGRGDSVTNLHLNMRDMVYLLVHSCEMKVKENNAKIHKACGETQVQDFSGYPCRDLNEEVPVSLPVDGDDRENVNKGKLDINLDEQIEDTECQKSDLGREQMEQGVISCVKHPGAIWDVFRREDVPKLTLYLRSHWEEFGKSDTVTSPLYSEAVYLNDHHKQKLIEEFGVEPWSFEQHLGQAVFVPAGCPFQVRNLQSTVQLGLDFLSPESLEQAVKLAEEIRCLSNDHATKLQMVEVGKISLYAASSAIKEVQKLVLDPKLGPELVFEDRNLTAVVSENLERMTRQRQAVCA